MRVHNVITDPCINCGCMYNGVPTAAAFPLSGSGEGVTRGLQTDNFMFPSSIHSL